MLVWMATLEKMLQPRPAHSYYKFCKIIQCLHIEYNYSISHHTKLVRDAREGGNVDGVWKL